MHDSLNYLRTLTVLPILSAILLYFVIKMAVHNGVKGATYRLTESIEQIERSLIELNVRISKKESD